jgi:hypothetical protein
MKNDMLSKKIMFDELETGKQSQGRTKLRSEARSLKEFGVCLYIKEEAHKIEEYGGGC